MAIEIVDFPMKNGDFPIFSIVMGQFTRGQWAPFWTAFLVPFLHGIFGASKVQELDLGFASQVGLRLTEESGPFLGP